MAPNRLINESSPYLKQHAHNPVDWYPWGEEALKKARDEDKLIFLSIGYSSCHWCHVMERESFEDEETAKVMNELFVNIKVDREERPDLDALYMEAIQVMTGMGGWPMSIWLTPDQKPVFGGTYFPKESMQGRPGFITICRRVDQLYRQEKDKLLERTEEVYKAITTDLYDHVETGELNRENLDKAVSIFKDQFEPVYGGFGKAPKFPQGMTHEFLLQYDKLSGGRDAKSMALYSVEKMIRGGLFDQISGGFHRYSTDDQWLVPHFEKMLYDNALLVSTLADICKISDQPLFREALDDTINWLEREMTGSKGEFYSALDADSEGVEGKFYIWKFDELQKVLDDQEFKTAQKWYGFSEGGNWEGVNIPTRYLQESDLENEEYELIKSARKKLFDARAKRTRPALDDKAIAAWNGMMLKALAKTALFFSHDTAHRLAVANADFICDTLWDKKQLWRIYKEGQTRQPAFLDDYGQVVEGLCMAFQLTGNEKYLNTAHTLAGEITKMFWDHKKSAFSYTASFHDELIANRRDIFDNALPGGTSSAIMGLLRTGWISGEPELVSIAEKAAARLMGVASEHATAFGYLLQTATLLLADRREIVLTGAEAEDFLKLWQNHYNPFDLVILADPGTDYTHPTLIGKTPKNGKSAAYICQNFHCEAPVTSPEQFGKKIEEQT